VRALLLAALFVAPLAIGAVHEPVFVPLLLVFAAAGLFAWRRARGLREWGTEVPPLPGARLLLALHALVLLQMVPLPAGLLRVVSPGSFAFYGERALVPFAWRPISVNPADSARGLFFLAGMSLLYFAVFHEFREERWRRRLYRTITAAAVVAAAVALVQAVSLHPSRIFGLWRPRWDWVVFGPYVNRNHFAGYMAMAIPLAAAFAIESWRTFGERWRTRRHRWPLLGSPEFLAAVRWTSAGALLAVALLASRSRGGLLAFAVSVAVLGLVLRRRAWQLAAVVVVGATVALLTVDLGESLKHFGRGVQKSRIELWMDALPMLEDFPVLGHGFNAFGTAYVRYQSQNRIEWFGEAHNEYLQSLLDMGIVGGALVGALLWTFLRRLARSSRLSLLDAGTAAALAALCAHNFVDFEWQIPANAAAFVALCATAMRRGEPPQTSWSFLSADTTA
jgi:O-antigen ligase